MISRSLEIIYPPFNMQFCVLLFRLEFFQNLTGCRPVASLMTLFTDCTNRRTRFGGRYASLDHLPMREESKFSAVRGEVVKQVVTGQ